MQIIIPMHTHCASSSCLSRGFPNDKAHFRCGVCSGSSGTDTAVYSVFLWKPSGLSRTIKGRWLLVHVIFENHYWHMRLTCVDKMAVTVFLLLPGARRDCSSHFTLREQGPMTIWSLWNTADWSASAASKQQFNRWHVWMVHLPSTSFYNLSVMTRVA